MIPAAATPRSPARRAIVLTVLSLLALALFARASLLHFEPALGAATQPALFWISMLPVLLVLGVLFALSGKLLFTAWTGFWLLWGLYLANHEKIEHLSRSLRPGDFSAVPTFLGSPGLFVPYLETEGGGLWLAGAGIALALLLLVFEPRSLRLAWWLRLPTAVVCGVMFLGLLRGGDWAEHFAPAYSDFKLWAPEEGMQRAGLVAGLVKMSWAAHVGPLRPDHGLVDRFQQDNTQPMRERRLRPMPAVLPDLVVIQSESLFDPADLRGYEDDTTLQEFRRLAARGLSGRLQVPTFAGGTIRTEYELLTGYPLEAFPSVEYPYLGIAMRTPTSLAHTLSAMGFETVMLHPYERDFWNRENALRALGFRDLYFEEHFYDHPTHGWYTSDAALFDSMLRLMPDDGPPRFMLGITMANHGPWSRDRGLTREEIEAQPVPDGVPDDVREELGNYLALLQAGDLALGRFADALLARERPTLLLVFGDHLPDLGATYQALGFDNDRKPWQQTVPYLLIGNVGYPQATLDTESEFLAALLLDALQVPFDGYFSVNASVRDALAFAPLEEADREHVRRALRAAAQLDYARGGLLQPGAEAQAIAAP